MKVHYKGVLCNLATYRVMGEDKPALYYIDSPDQETMLKAGFVDVQPCLWVKVLTVNAPYPVPFLSFEKLR